MYNYLYSQRVRRGLTQQALAEKSGVSRRTVCRLEQSGKYPSLAVGMRLCRTLRCDFEEVFPLEISL